jgi:hypothetical protein
MYRKTSNGIVQITTKENFTASPNVKNENDKKEDSNNALYWVLGGMAFVILLLMIQAYRKK